MTKTGRPSKPSRNLVTSSFYQNIYASRSQLLDLQKLKSRAWPDSVYVMDETYDIDGPTWTHPVNGEPCTLFAWVECLFKTMHNASLSEVQSALRIWWGTYDRVVSYMIAHKLWKAGETERLAHNTAWALLGYEVNQASDALDLAHKIFMSPEEFKSSGLLLQAQNRQRKELHDAKEKTIIPTGLGEVHADEPTLKVCRSAKRGVPTTIKKGFKCGAVKKAKTSPRHTQEQQESSKPPESDLSRAKRRSYPIRSPRTR